MIGPAGGGVFAAGQRGSPTANHGGEALESRLDGQRISSTSDAVSAREPHHPPPFFSIDAVRRGSPHPTPLPASETRRRRVSRPTTAPGAEPKRGRRLPPPSRARPARTGQGATRSPVGACLASETRREARVPTDHSPGAKPRRGRRLTPPSRAISSLLQAVRRDYGASVSDDPAAIVGAITVTRTQTPRASGKQIRPSASVIFQ